MKKKIVTALLVGYFLGVGFAIFVIYFTTSSPPAYVVNNLDKLMACAKNEGFIISRPTIRIIKRPYRKDIRDGYAYTNFNIITLTDYASYRTLAHELGHMVDAQTGRKGHPFFIGKEDMDYQLFANAIRDVIIDACKAT